MASGQVYVTNRLPQNAREAGIKETVVEGLVNLGDTILSGTFTFLQKFIDLAKTNPLWGAVLGVLVVDLMSHKVNWLAWTHEELQWVTTDSEGTVTAYGLLVQAYDWLSGTHTGQTQITVTLPGVISSTAAITITGLVLSGFGIAAAGEILGDITKITNLAGSADPASVITPSVTTLVEGGAQPAWANVALGGAKAPPAGVA